MTEDITIFRALPTGGCVEEVITVNVPQAGTKFGTFRGPWGVCALCNVTLPQAELSTLQGKFYCSKYNCYSSKLIELQKAEGK